MEGDTSLFNPYGVITVNPEKNPNIHSDEANAFVDWIISVPVQEQIAAFGVEEFGQSLFVPDSAAWPDGDRTVWCMVDTVGQPAGEGSVRNSRR